MSIKINNIFLSKEIKAALGFSHQVFFIPVFLAFLVFISYWPKNINVPLEDFTNYVIGTATLKNIDVAFRVKLFYRSLFLSVSVFIFTNYLVNRFLLRVKNAKTEVMLMNLFAVFGLIHILATLPMMEQSFALQTILWMMGALLFLVIISTVFSFKNNVSNSTLLLSALIILNLIILIPFFHVSFNPKILMAVFVFFAVSLLFHAKKSTETAFFRQLFYVRILLLLIPAIILGQELTWVVYNRFGYYLHPYTAFFVMTGVIMLLLFLFDWGISPDKKISRLKSFYTFLSFAGILLFASYVPVYNYSGELFEVANPANGLMMIFKYGQWPVMEFLSTHLTSDLFYGLFYFLLNGYSNSLDFLAYSSMYNFLMLLLFFLILNKITQNTLFSVVFILFFPFLDILLWRQTAWVIFLVPFTLYFVFRKPGIWNYLILFLLLIFQMAWSPDTGFTVVIVTFLGLVLLFFHRFSKANILSFIKAFVLILSLAFLVFIIFRYVLQLPVDNILHALSFYSTSIQARGLPNLSLEMNRFFSLHHVLIPFLIIIVSLLTFKGFRNNWRQNPFLYITIFVFTVVYFANIQRGLTRHNFAEGSDWNIASYSYIVLAFSVFLLRLKEQQKHILFIVTAGFLIYFVKFPTPPLAKPYITKMSFNLAQLPLHGNMSRVNIPAHIQNNKIAPLKDFFDKRLNDHQTFYDFSNSPALYFFLQKKPPQYFIHSLAVTNENLQKQQIAILENEKPPFIIYSHMPRTWWDDSDGVPNEVRFHLIAEYLFQHYSPDTVIANYSIWKNHEAGQQRMEQYMKQSYNLYFLPLLSGQTSSIGDNMQKSFQTRGKSYMIVDHKRSLFPAVLKIVIAKSQKKARAIINYYAQDSVLGSYSFLVKKTDQPVAYCIRMSTQYHWMAFEVDSLRVDFPGNKVTVRNMELWTAKTSETTRN